MKKTFVFVAFLLFGFAMTSHAQDDDAELAKKLANPIASLISVPFQNNTDYGIGTMKGIRNTMNIQPVVPISINKDWNMITRIVAPVITQYNITGMGEKQSGLADAVMSAFFSPKNSEKLTWGVGPAFLLPIATNDYLASKKFGMGPTVVALKQMNGWTLGALANQIWSVAGDQDRSAVNQMFVQPFVVYNWKSGAGLGGNLEWTQNWESSSSTVWLNPVLSGVTSLGKQKTQLAIGPRFNLAAPDGGKADWGWRAVVIFLFPK
ncbi:hypothetical protein GCM10009119_22570 [Algoriphagus jejuensis]|uniref:Outer membrane beta-barrel porin/alpha-amylase n=1 Tax=Algoriphagus jejuensis TaxID=419934 RepID=A0ABN1N0Z4_9BACT